MKALNANDDLPKYIVSLGMVKSKKNLGREYFGFEMVAKTDFWWCKASLHITFHDWKNYKVLLSVWIIRLDNIFDLKKYIYNINKRMDNFKNYHNVEKEITLESKVENDYLYVLYKDKMGAN